MRKAFKPPNREIVRSGNGRHYGLIMVPLDADYSENILRVDDEFVKGILLRLIDHVAPSYLRRIAGREARNVVLSCGASSAMWISVARRLTTPLRERSNSIAT